MGEATAPLCPTPRLPISCLVPCKSSLPCSSPTGFLAKHSGNTAQGSCSDHSPDVPKAVALPPSSGMVWTGHLLSKALPTLRRGHFSASQHFPALRHSNFPPLTSIMNLLSSFLCLPHCPSLPLECLLFLRPSAQSRHPLIFVEEIKAQVNPRHDLCDELLCEFPL